MRQLTSAASLSCQRHASFVGSRYSTQPNKQGPTSPSDSRIRHKRLSLAVPLTVTKRKRAYEDHSNCEKGESKTPRSVPRALQLISISSAPLLHVLHETDALRLAKTALVVCWRNRALSIAALSTSQCSLDVLISRSAHKLQTNAEPQCEECDHARRALLSNQENWVAAADGGGGWFLTSPH